MRDQLRSYIEEIFASVQKTSKVNEMKEELLSDLYTKYDDLIAQGRSEEDAYKIAIGGLGDVNEILKNLENDKIYNYAKKEEQRHRSAIFVSTAVGLYILAVAAVILFAIIGDNIGSDILAEVGCVAMFVIAAVATMLLVYNGMSKAKYDRVEDTIVESYKEKTNKADNANQVYKSIVATLWPISVIIFFILGMFLHLWYVCWVVFILAAGVQSLIKLIFILNSKNPATKDLSKASSGILWPFIVSIYFIVSFATMMWAYTWLIFIIGVAAEALIKSLFELRREK